MYEGFFELTQRPFSAVPRAEEFVPVPPLQDALESLLHCISQSRGIATVTSAPGMGKTVLCQRAARTLEADYRVIQLTSSGVHSRRALIQAILFEMGIDYVGLSEQEARLKLIRAVRDGRAEGRFTVLILDEAHLLSPRLFEELRSLTDHAADGQSMIRLILCGQFELEEKLADPALDAFNQRIGVQVCLESLSLEESARLIAERLRASGADDPFTVITEPALELVCRASDGNLRCLTQLMDTALLLAFAEDVRPVDETIVRAALKDLKELPLHWSDIGDEPSPHESEAFSQFDESLLDAADEPAPSPPEHREPGEFDTDEFVIPAFLKNSSEAQSDEPHVVGEEEPPEEEFLRTAFLPVAAQRDFTTTGETEPESSDADFAVLEVGPDLDTAPPAPSRELAETTLTAATSSPAEEVPPAMLPPAAELPSGIYQPHEADMIETPVIDRYTLLDRRRELPEDRWNSIDLSQLEQLETEVEVEPPLIPAEETGCDTHPSMESRLLETVQGIRHEILERIDHVRLAEFEALRQAHAEPCYDAVLPEDAPLMEYSQVAEPLAPEACAPEPVPSEPLVQQSPQPATFGGEDEDVDEPAGERRYEHLFSRLRRRRRQVAGQTAGR